MQPQDSFNVSRRALDVEDYIDILRRHKGWIFGPFLFTLVATVVGVYLWEDSYSSQAAVRIVPQQVPQNLVQAAVNQDMIDRISGMSQQIRSRTQLTNIINTFGLYQKERSRYPIEDVLEMMNRKIEVVPLGQTQGGRQVPAFAVSFSYKDRILAQRVVQDLVTRFIDENTRQRGGSTFQTTQFLKDQVDRAKKELDDLEGKLTEFRLAHAGSLPDNMNSNVQSLQAAQANLMYLSTAISRAQQEKLQLETNLRIARDNTAAITKEAPEQADRQSEQQAMQMKNERLVEVEREIASLENVLANLRKTYKDNYPDVQTVMGRLSVAKQRRDEIAKEDAAQRQEAEAKRIASPAKARPTMNQQAVRDLRELDARAKLIESAIASKDQEINDFNAQQKRSNEQIRMFTGRIEVVPVGERQYTDINRERDMARDKYVKLQENFDKAKIAEDMENRKQGENLELLDPASLPINPTEPKRPMIISLGAAVGFILGLCIACFREVKDTALKNLKDVRAYTQLAILGSVPLLENDFVVRRRRRLAWLGWTTACLASVVTMASAVAYYYVTKV